MYRYHHQSADSKRYEQQKNSSSEEIGHEQQVTSLSPRFFTINIPTGPAAKKREHPVGRPPKEIIIGGDPREKPPATIEVKGSYRPPPVVVVIDKHKDKNFVPDVIQVQDMPLPPTKDVNNKSPIQPLEPGGVDNITAAAPSRMAKGGSSSQQQLVSSSLHKKELAAGSPIPEISLVKRSSHSSNRAAEQQDILASRGRGPTPITHIVIERRPSPDPPAAKDTTSKKLLPDYTTIVTKQRHSESQRRTRKSMKSRDGSIRSSSYHTTTTLTTQKLHKSWPAPPHYGRHHGGGGGGVLGSRPRPRTRTPQWLGVTGTPEDWIQAITTAKTDESQLVGRREYSTHHHEA